MSLTHNSVAAKVLIIVKQITQIVCCRCCTLSPNVTATVSV
jgi:hypothetical protein